MCPCDSSDDEDVITMKERYKTVILYVDGENVKFPFKIVDVNQLGNTEDKIMLTYRFLNENRRRRIIKVKFPEENAEKDCRLFAKVRFLTNNWLGFE